MMHDYYNIRAPFVYALKKEQNNNNNNDKGSLLTYSLRRKMASLLSIIMYVKFYYGHLGASLGFGISNGEHYETLVAPQ